VFVVRSGGSETVLDALSGVAGLTEKLPGASLHLTRKGPDGQPDQVLPIDWLGIALQSDPKTNYQLQPGDRLYVGLKK
jgi:polysaccharide biosynthesis/export protein